MKLQISNKIKTLALLPIGIIVCYICYHFAFSKTIAAYMDIAKSTSWIKKHGNYNQQIKTVEKQLKANPYSVPKTTKSSMSQDILLQNISEYSKGKNIRINQIPETKYAIEGSYTVETNMYRIQGNFIDLIQLVYEIEHIQKLAKVSSLTIQQQLDRTNKNTYTEATIYLQNIK